MQLLVSSTIRLATSMALAMGLAVSPAAAASCKTWRASMTEDEGGPAMTATVCTDGSDASPTLVLQCPGHPSLRYDLGEKAGAGLDPGVSAQFSFTSGTSSVTRKLDLEEMDDMFVVDLKAADPLLALLQSGHDVTVADTGGKYPGNSFSLSGSRAAIGKVLASCHASASPAGDDD